MRKILLSMLLVMGLALPAVAQPRMSPLEFACDFLEIDCKGIAPPSIIVTDEMGRNGLYGMYRRGEDRVYIDPEAPAHVVVHEVTHYMLYEAGFRLSRCMSEEAARRVHHAWAGTEYDDWWRIQYQCTGGQAITIIGWK